MLQTVSSIRDLHAALLPWRENGETVALVPTMGALHKGHMTLVEAARKIATRVVVSIFVNPLQFGPKEDLAKYPRPIEADQKLLNDGHCDLLYLPPASEMYPEGFAAHIDPGPLARMLEGASRPGHFDGVATVVTKLLMQTLPTMALFGEKDYQQLLVIRRTARDLDLPIPILGVPTVRDADGLALSSRNIYLSPDERRRAAVLPQTMMDCIQRILGGEDTETVLNTGRARLTEVGFVVDYLELADAGNLAPVRDVKVPARLLAAARMGTTRLIDNMAVDKA